MPLREPWDSPPPSERLRDKLKRLYSSLDEARKYQAQLTLLSDSPEFRAWINQEIIPTRSAVISRIMDPKTKGYAHDFLKSILRFLDHLVSRQPSKLLDLVTEECERIDQEINKTQASIEKMEVML